MRPNLKRFHLLSRQRLFTALLMVVTILLLPKPAQASADIADIESRMVVVQKDLGEVSHFHFYFFPRKFGDLPGKHFYPKTVKAFLDYLNHTLGQGKYVWVKTGYRAEDCSAANWSKLALNIQKGSSGFGTPPELQEEVHLHDQNWNAQRTPPRYDISFCRKLRTFRKGELEHDIAITHTIGQGTNARARFNADQLFLSNYADRKDVQLLPVGGPNREERINRDYGYSRNYLDSEKFYSPEFKTKESFVWDYTIRTVERTADGDPSKPYYWKGSVPKNIAPVEPPKPVVITPSAPADSSPIVLTGKPDNAAIWAEKLKSMWADAALRDAELAGKVAEENARLNKYKNDSHAQMDELTRNFCKTADGPKSCACRRAGAPLKVCPR